MKVELAEIEARHARRQALSKQMQEVLPPLITDPASYTEHAKKLSVLQKEYQSACFMVDADMSALLAVVDSLLPKNAEARISQWKSVVDPLKMDKAVLLRLAQQEEANRKERKEVPGQLQVGDVVQKDGKVKKGKLAKVINPQADLVQEAKEATA